MAPSNVFLYRSLLKSCKELFLPENVVFLQSALDCISEEIRSLPYGTEFERRLPGNPRNELKKAFTQGSATDVNVLWSVLPTVLRFSRAAKLISEQFPRQLKEQSPWSIKKPSFYPPKDDSNMLPGAVLISKLHYTETELKERNVDHIIEQGVKVLAKILREEFDRESAALPERLAPFQTSELQTASFEELQRLRVLPMIRALHETILRAEANRIRVPGPYEPLVDKILRPERPYQRGMAITYSVLYSAVLRSLGRSIQGLGISYPRDFKLRIVAKWGQRNNTVLSMAPQNIGIRSHRRHKRDEPHYDEVNFLELKGRWVGHIGESMQEAVVTYDSSTRVLQATKVDGDQFLPAGEVVWKVNLAQVCKTSNLLLAGVAYDCEVQVAPGSYLPYLLTIHTLPASIFLPQFAVNGMYSANPYYEIVLEPVVIDGGDGGREDLIVTGQATYPDSEVNSTSVNMRVATGGAALSQDSHPRTSLTTITRTHTGSATHPSLSTHHEPTGSVHHPHENSSSSTCPASPRSDSMTRSSRTNRGAVGGADAKQQQAVRLASHSQDIDPGMLKRAADAASAAYDAIKRSTSTSTSTSTTASSANAATVAVVAPPSDSISYPTTQGQEWQPQVLRFCRTIDLDRCLLEVSDSGVKVVTPCTYQQELRDYAYPTDDFPSLLNPATAYKVAQRMANNLTHSSMKEGREEDAVFWKAVAKLFEYRLKQADRY